LVSRLQAAGGKASRRPAGFLAQDPGVDGGDDLDRDLENRGREELLLEVRRLRAAIRAHRDSSGQELCWHHPALWGLLPERTDPVPAVPEWPQFLRGCIRYRQSLDEQLPDAPRISDEFDEFEPRNR
jgi:hypothetical protein